ncbi:MAG: hypothetical protein KGN34_17560 [Sphingomonadales bacterium]|nr:hypothetical protein [Sphingomonadales bacterium]
MKSALILPVAALALLIAPQAAEAKGCIRGALVGGVAGHYAGHHGLIGAAGGCLVARHHYAKKAEQERARQDEARRSQRH